LPLLKFQPSYFNKRTAILKEFLI